MHRATVLHWVLVWILCIALPVQGLAAQGLAACSAGHHDPLRAAGHSVPWGAATDAQGLLTAWAAHEDCHGAAGHHRPVRPAQASQPVAADASAAATASLADTAEPDSPTASSCSACGVCCAAVLPVAPAAWALGHPAAAFGPWAAHRLLQAAPTSLERPPRNLQA